MFNQSVESSHSLHTLLHAAFSATSCDARAYLLPSSKDAFLSSKLALLQAVGKDSQFSGPSFIDTYLCPATAVG